MNIILIYFALKYNGDWDKVYKALEEKEKVSLKDISSLEKRIEEEKWNVITILDIDYPKQLKSAYKPPFVLWYKGNRELLKNNICCLTGNQVTDNVKNWSKSFVSELSKNFTLITAAYMGVDRHIIDISKEMMIFVLASGHDDESISKSNKSIGLVLTEYPPQTKVSKDNLRNRNRLIAAFSNYLILLSSEKNGGINNLVSQFLNLGKEIYCLPGDGSENDGNSELVKQGASLITSVTDIAK